MPDLFLEKIWVVSPLSWHQTCSRNKFGVVSPSSWYSSCSWNNFGLSLHWVNTKFVPGTTLGSLSIEPTLKLFPEQLWVSLSVELILNLLFLEQFWVASPSSQHQTCSRNNFGCALHWADMKVVPGTTLGVLSIEPTPNLFLEQLLTKVFQKANLDYTITDANYNKSVFYYVNPYTLTLTLILILLLMIIFHLVLFPSKLCRAHINVFRRYTFT